MFKNLKRDEIVLLQKEMKMTKAGKYIEDQVLSSRCLKPWINAAVHEYSTSDGYNALRQLQGSAEMGWPDIHWLAWGKGGLVAAYLSLA
jgi:hypothetical protein